MGRTIYSAIAVAVILLSLAGLLSGCYGQGYMMPNMTTNISGLPSGNTTSNQSKPLNATNMPRAYGIEVYYCQGIGYKFDYRNVSGKMKEYCLFPDGHECDAFDFVAGDCVIGRNYSLCTKKGYTPKIGVEQYETYNKTYAVCIFPDGSYCKEADFFNHKCHVDW